MKRHFFALLLLFALLITLCACGAEPEITGISVDSADAKYWYLSGQEIDPTGLVITAELSDGTTRQLDPAECEFVKPPFIPCGEKEVKVTCGEFEASFPIYTCPGVTERDNFVTYQIRSNENGSRVSLTPVLVPGGKPFVMIFPGGAYQACSPYGNEGYAYAEVMQAAGYNSFILEYSIKMEHPAPLDDVNTAMDIILDNLDFFDTTTDNYAVMGSSAGGHLAGTWCTDSIGYAHYGKDEPAALLLCYAATHTFEGRRPVLTGENPSEELRRSLSVDENVTPDFTPTYQWVFDQDNDGITEHTVLMDAALEAAGVDHMTMIYPGTEHGCGLAKGLSAEGWIDDAIAFWEAHMK